MIVPGARRLIGTGLFCEIPEGWEIQVRPRSGLTYKSGVTVLNAPGTIDSDYRGELKVLLINLGDQGFRIRPGDRIAQIVVAPAPRASFSWASGTQGQETARGSGGFGSTGISTPESAPDAARAILELEARCLPEEPEAAAHEFRP